VKVTSWIRTAIITSWCVTPLLKYTTMIINPKIAIKIEALQYRAASILFSILILFGDLFFLGISLPDINNPIVPHRADILVVESS
jgi:hypothetical protein